MRDSSSPAAASAVKIVISGERCLSISHQYLRNNIFAGTVYFSMQILQEKALFILLCMRRSFRDQASDTAAAVCNVFLEFLAVCALSYNYLPVCAAKIIGGALRWGLTDSSSY